MEKTDAKLAMAPVDSDAESPQVGELIHLEDVDVVLAEKLRLVNDAIDEIGWTPYHTKLFCLNGFGYAADSMLGFLPSIAASSVVAEFKPAYDKAGQLSIYIGLLVGALFWGITADIIGRKWAFNLSLMISASFMIVAGAAPNYTAWCAFDALLAFGSGGNLVLDTTAFLEYLPHDKTWAVTLMAAWWGVGQTIPGLIAWGFLPNFSCAADAVVCTKADNMGWRYLFWTSGGIILIMSILRVTVIHFHETPKFAVCNNDDEGVVRTLGGIAKKYNRPFSLTTAQLQACGRVDTTHAKKGAYLSELVIHYKGLFTSRTQKLSVSLIWLSWALIGMAYPLFYIFLPEYFASRGASFGSQSVSQVWSNYAITNACAIPGPIFAGYLCRTRLLGRKYTMLIGGLLSMAFLCAYTTARNNQQSLAFSCATSIVINVYYGTLYAYTPETLPSAHRATGNGTAVAINRLLGIMSVVVATFANTSTSAPIWIAAVLFGVLGLVAAVFPLEPARGRSV